MRRIYESSALDRDDDDPHRPNESDERPRPEASRTIPSRALSDALLPAWLAYRGISVRVETPETVPEGVPVPITVRMRNSFPFPVSLRTQSPLMWQWYVDGHPEASYVPEEPDGDASSLRFDRGELKEFTRRWHQKFKVAATEWEPIEPGDYAIGVAINVDDAPAKGLADETTVRITNRRGGDSER